MNNGYEPGLASISFRKHTPREILLAMQKAELAAIEWGSDVHAPCHDGAALCDLAALTRAHGVRCCSYGTYFRLGETPLEELSRYVDAAHVLGTDVLRLWCGKGSGADMTAQEREALLTECHRAAALAEREGVTLCMECHKRTFTERTEDALLLMNEINSPRFRMYWQPFQWQEPRENAISASKLAKFTKHIHVFNWKGDARLPLADAVCEWQAYIKAFPAPRTLLLEFMPHGTIEELAGEARSLKLIIGEDV